MTVMRDAEGSLINVNVIRERFLKCQRSMARTVVFFEGEQLGIYWPSVVEAEEFERLLAGESVDQPSMFTPQLVPSAEATAQQMHVHLTAGGFL